VKKFHMKSHVKFHKWKDFTWNHMWHFTCERISHEITCEISHVKGFHMKSHVTFHMWRDFTWNYYKWNFTCKRSSHQIINYKWNFTCERIHMKLQITSEISHVKGFRMKLQVKFHMWKDKVIRISFSHEITYYKVKFYMYVKGFHMKL
jgi:hypothetical protein